MKNLSNEQIITIIENCGEKDLSFCENKCPLFEECLFYFTGEKCGSALEEEDE